MGRLGAPEAVARGRALFLSYCALCHGDDASGQGSRHTHLNRPPPDLRRRAWRDGTDPAKLMRLLREGRPGTSMPSWRFLSEEERADVVSYLWSLADGP